MKKLMIAVAIVCAAVMSQAANYTWGLTSGADEGSAREYLTDDPGFTAMLFMGSIGQTANGDGTYSLDFSGATYVTQTSAFDGEYYTIGDLAFDAGRTSDAVTGAAGQAFSILVLDTGSGIADYAKYEGTYAIVTGTGALNADPETSTAFTEFKYSSAVTGAMYKTAAVPEPTSGLLLLLGVAGLALKRKRA